MHIVPLNTFAFPLEGGMEWRPLLMIAEKSPNARNRCTVFDVQYVQYVAKFRLLFRLTVGFGLCLCLL